MFTPASGRFRPDARCLYALALFSGASWRPAIPDEPPIRPATREEIAQGLSFALQSEGRKRVHQAGGLMAQITAERLVRHLEWSEFVWMKKPPAVAPISSASRLPVTPVSGNTD